MYLHITPSFNIDRLCKTASVLLFLVICVFVQFKFCLTTCCLNKWQTMTNLKVLSILLNTNAKPRRCLFACSKMIAAAWVIGDDTALLAIVLLIGHRIWHWTMLATAHHAPRRSVILGTWGRPVYRDALV